MHNPQKQNIQSKVMMHFKLIL